VEFWQALFQNAAAAASEKAAAGASWEVWADTPADAARKEVRIGSFEWAPAAPPPAAPGRVPIWRMV
jgi:hypothetical protein